MWTAGQINDCRLQIYEHVAYCLLIIAYCLLPTAYCSLVHWIINHILASTHLPIYPSPLLPLLPSAFCLLPLYLLPFLVLRSSEGAKEDVFPCPPKPWRRRMPFLVLRSLGEGGCLLVHWLRWKLEARSSKSKEVILLIDYCRLPTADCLLPTAGCLRPP